MQGLPLVYSGKFDFCGTDRIDSIGVRKPSCCAARGKPQRNCKVSSSR